VETAADFGLIVCESEFSWIDNHAEANGSVNWPRGVRNRIGKTALVIFSNEEDSVKRMRQSFAILQQ